MALQKKVICIIQARMGSSRLPGKVLQEICAHPMLYWVAKRAVQAKSVHEVVIATTDKSEDDPIEQFCRSENIACFRGSDFDVLDRFYQTARQYRADIVVRLTADCPLIDPALIDDAVDRLESANADFCANRLPPPYPRTYPIGLDVEVVTFKALERAWKHALQLYEREHVLPYLYDPANSFKVELLDSGGAYGSLRWTVDTLEDLIFVREVFKYLECRMAFNWQDVLRVVNNHPELMAINADVSHKSYNDVDQRTSK